jgi:DNA invertase Pin-like site-specific DNA recombinase
VESSTRAIAYTRVSTGKQAESGLGLDDQRSVIEKATSHRGWEIVDWATDAGVSAKTIKRRPGLTEALGRLDAGEADVLIVAKLDRLSRSVADFANLTERARKGGWKVVVLDIDVDSTTAAGELTVNVIVSAAQYERRLISDRVKAAHRQLHLRGSRSGQRPILDEAVRQRVARARRDGLTYAAIAEILNEEEVPTAKGGRWHPSTVRHVVRSVELDEALGESAYRMR